MGSNAAELAIGFILGIATNFIVWALLFHYLVPTIRFSPHVSKVPIKKTREDKSGFRYRFKIENAGKRDIIDIELFARLSVKGLRTPTIWNTLYIPLSPDGEAAYRIPRLKPAVRGRVARRRIMFFYTNSTDVLRDWSIFPQKLRQGARKKALLLEDLLAIGSKARLEIHAYCYDSFSGTRKLFTSKPYTAKDIVEGAFDPSGLTVLPSQEIPAILEASEEAEE